MKHDAIITDFIRRAAEHPIEQVAAAFAELAGEQEHTDQSRARMAALRLVDDVEGGE